MLLGPLVSAKYGQSEHRREIRVQEESDSGLLILLRLRTDHGFVALSSAAVIPEFQDLLHSLLVPGGEQISFYSGSFASSCLQFL